MTSARCSRHRLALLSHSAREVRSCTRMNSAGTTGRATEARCLCIRPPDARGADAGAAGRSFRSFGLVTDKRVGDGPLVSTSIRAAISGSGLPDASLVVKGLVGV